MVDDLRGYRKDYRRNLDIDMRQTPPDIFSTLFTLAEKECEANAAVLSSYNPKDGVSSRVILVKEHADCNFKFFTNYESRKGKDLEIEKRSSLLFYYPQLEAQIRFEGEVGKLNCAENDEYFYSRPLLSQISACISEQSEEIKNVEYFENKFSIPKGRLSPDTVLFDTMNYLKTSTHKLIRPLTWGGYRFFSKSVEFWFGGENRLHHRYKFYRTENDSEHLWNMRRLNP